MAVQNLVQKLVEYYWTFVSKLCGSSFIVSSLYEKCEIDHSRYEQLFHCVNASSVSYNLIFFHKRKVQYTAGPK